MIGDVQRAYCIAVAVRSVTAIAALTTISEMPAAVEAAIRGDTRHPTRGLLVSKKQQVLLYVVFMVVKRNRASRVLTGVGRQQYHGR